MTLGDVSRGRNNNLNFLRMAAAICVLISHSYALSTGNPGLEPLASVMPLTLGGVSVLLFFAISGFLIAKSYETRRSLTEFATARVLRIYPGLFVALVFCAFVVGPVCTALPLSQYFGRHVLTFVPDELTLVRMRDGLPGVFLNNPYPVAINGSLWTLYYEVACYIFVVLAGLAGMLRTRRFAWCLLVYVGIYAIVRIKYGFTGSIGSYLDLTLPFALGMGLYVYRARIVLSAAVFGAFLLATVLLRHTTCYREAIVLTVVYGTFWLGFVGWSPLHAYNRLGDYSYGTYIFAWPIQQTVAHFLPGINGPRIIALALPVTLLLAVISWHFIEHPILSRRHTVAEALEIQIGRLRKVPHSVSSV